MSQEVARSELISIHQKPALPSRCTFVWCGGGVYLHDLGWENIQKEPEPD